LAINSKVQEIRQQQQQDDQIRRNQIELDRQPELDTIKRQSEY
jgi:hypothetical protein